MSRWWKVEIEDIGHFVFADYRPLLNTGTGHVYVHGVLADRWAPCSDTPARVSRSAT